ncbi:intradiol ring-cleavage dioxygenase [Thioclava sp. GXIMD2076]|uniref:Intradiol ring-cleavage dioxygenase n=1 Tax=Thioclava kandeliae TaxID=3070818 RepID=A0ABV1SDA0_9RHOB
MTSNFNGLSRRNLMKVLAASPVAVTGAGIASMAHAEAEAAAQSVGLISGNMCLVSPETTEGPYYIDPKLVRADIREDKEGIAMTMQLQVVDENCQPMANARVDIWHCDAEGNYSGYASQGSEGTLDTEGETFLRGTQMTDESGIVSFQTIYPGWYRGRTTHIHYKVFLDETNVLTSQIFFPDALSQYIYDNIEPYTRDSTRDTYNAIDGILQAAGDGAYTAIREQSEMYLAQLVVGVDPDAVSQEGSGPGGAPKSANMGEPPEGAAPEGGAPGQPPEQSAGDLSPEDLIPGSKTE